MGIGFYVNSRNGYIWVPPMEDSVINAKNIAFENECRKKTKVVKL